MSGTGTTERPRGIAPPRGTWVFMLLALALTLLLTPLTNLVFEWFGNGTLWPLALILTIIALGLVGAVPLLRPLHDHRDDLGSVEPERAAGGWARSLDLLGVDDTLAPAQRSTPART